GRQKSGVPSGRRHLFSIVPVAARLRSAQSLATGYLLPPLARLVEMIHALLEFELGSHARGQRVCCTLPSSPCLFQVRRDASRVSCAARRDLAPACAPL